MPPPLNRQPALGGSPGRPCTSGGNCDGSLRCGAESELCRARPPPSSPAPSLPRPPRPGRHPPAHPLRHQARLPRLLPPATPPAPLYCQPGFWLALAPTEGAATRGVYCAMPACARVQLPRLRPLHSRPWRRAANPFVTLAAWHARAPAELAATQGWSAGH